MTNSLIHPTAIIDPQAELGLNVEVGAYSIIGPQVMVGDRTKIGPHCVITGKTRIGPNNLISSFASLGSRPQDLKYRGEDTALEIGSNNMFREYCNVSLGTEGGGGVTRIGSQNLFMVYTHVAHDCQIADECIIANSVALAGHVTLEKGAVLGGLAAVHQFCRIGYLAMVGGGAMVTQDVAPFTMVQGDRATLQGLNVVGIKRKNMPSELVSQIKNMYRILFKDNLGLDEAIKTIEASLPPSEYKEIFLTFLKVPGRGICR